MSHFFIDRPIFAWVIAIIVSLAGGLSMMSLPISQYPNIAPPSVAVNATYLGASAKTVEDSVTQVIEQQMKGLDHLLYMSSTSDSFGGAKVTLTFDTGTNPDIAQVQVQNKLQAALTLLPSDVQRQGVTVAKSSSSFLLIVAFYSEDGSMGGADMADYVATYVQDPISRIDGIGDVTLFGGKYAMRIWLDPSKLYKYNLTTEDVATAVQSQNVQVSVGQLGGTPAVDGQQINATVTAQSRLQTAEEFENILLRVRSDGSQVLIKDVARVELGSENYNLSARYKGQAATGLALSLASGANALKTAQAVKDKMVELAPFMPPGMKVVYPYDTTPFVKTSIKEVVKTLFEAILLVFLVMFLFLQNIRATLIPTIAVPVVLLGTFAALSTFGFSINMLTMFALVLAIGLLVDDAIVVVENVERLMSEEGLSPKEAAKKSMTQITGALVGVVLVLCAVFIPMAFFGGATGVIYRQFSVTLASAMLLSVMVALILTPALCATMLKPVPKGHHAEKGGFFGWFNRSFDRASKGYQGIVARIIRGPIRSMLVYVAIFAAVAFLFMRLPTSFLPDEDQGIIFGMVQLPAGATKEATLKVIEQVEQHFLVDEKDAVEATMAVAGFSFAGNGQNMGAVFIKLKDWDERKSDKLRAPAIIERARPALAKIRNASVFAFAPPAIIELGNATGFDMFLQDRAGLGHDKLMEARNELLGKAGQNKMLASVRPNGQSDTPQFQIDIDHAKAGAFNLSQSTINATLSSAWGGTYINDFVDKGRVKRVYMQADAPYRMMPENIKDWYVRNTDGEMVAFSSFTNSRWDYGSPRLERYNGVSAVEIQGEAARGLSSGTAMQEMETLVANLPKGVGMEWTGMSFQERIAGAKAPMLYALSIMVVFLCLAALYESWTIPLSVILVVPLGVIGMLIAVQLRGYSNDIYFQVGLLTIIGLSAKNAILIVEFAKNLQEQGMGLYEATIEAVHIRLRPILMTSMAFGLGVLPLALNRGAGSGGQNVIGTGVVGGMITTTIFGIFLIPVFFVVVRSIFKSDSHGGPKADAATTTTPPQGMQEGH